MYVIALTGGIGSGKSSVSKLFQDLGIDIIDTDLIAREVVAPGTEALEKIKSYFGAAVVDSQGQLNRSRLRQEIFADKSKKTWLENLLHPLIRQSMHEKISNSKSAYCITVIPLLFETQQKITANRVLVVECDPELQISRVMQRDHCNRDDAKKIIAAQVNPEIRRQGADDIIQNNGSYEELKQQVLNLHEKYLKSSQKL